MLTIILIINFIIGSLIVGSDCFHLIRNDKSTKQKILINKYNKVKKQTTNRTAVTTLTDNDLGKNNATLTVKPYRKAYRDPESLENIQKFIAEINQLGSRTPGYSVTSEVAQGFSNSTFTNELNDPINFDRNTNIRLQKLEKNSWKQACRNYHNRPDSV